MKSSLPWSQTVAQAGGANDFLRKPYDPNELIARVSAAAATKRLTDQMESAETLLFGLARMVEAKDECTGDHCSRLAHYAELFGAALGLGACRTYAESTAAAG